MSTYVLFNSLSGNGTGKTKAEAIKPFLEGKELIFEDVTKITDAKEFFAGLNSDDELYLCGGDGTLNRFINNTEGIDIVQPLYFFPTGTGNDFWNDLGRKVGDAPVQINEYIKDLPFVEVNGMKVSFTGDYPTLIAFYTDVPGVISKVTAILAKEHINVAFMKVFRSAKRSDACMVIETDAPVPHESIARIQSEVDGIEEICTV